MSEMGMLRHLHRAKFLPAAVLEWTSVENAPSKVHISTGFAVVRLVGQLVWDNCRIPLRWFACRGKVHAASVQ